jgi:dTDP-4-dehydrorhamnose reductase
MNGSSKGVERRPRVLVTGAGGLVGGRLAVLLSDRFEVVAGVHEALGPPGLAEERFDLLSAPETERALLRGEPAAVVHCAALADLDRCEREPERARAVNVEATARLAWLSRARGFRLILISTDVVFGGERPFWRESDAPQPLMLYGRTKRAAEEIALTEAPQAAVLRVCLVSGRGHGRRASCTEAIAWALQQGRSLRLYTDQYRTPVDPESIAAAVGQLVLGAPGGLYHLGGPERLSRYQLGQRVARVLGLPEQGIEAGRHADSPLMATRPADVSLDTTLARRVLGYAPRPLETAIREGRPAPP